ncbi:MAG: ABC transporter permease [Centipeda sp. (in: firmicutes)]|uniref:ABC transporter permease n=1 Tax=Selenomonas sp. oral taxon 920 TaxID=1884263 RepID=UPI00084099A1|nr:ABC transporter permease [Selenomonas sp. oral taxon 920]AOH48389.1 multidrug ABC transporter permease [Selenomonas sp. oral taxon 920]
MLRDIWTVFWRDWIVLRRRLTKYILSRMVSPLMFLIAFGWGLGRSIDVGTGSYLDFLVPGLLAMNSMNISFNSIISVHAERVYHKSLEEYLIAPIRPDAFVVGKVAGAVVRGLISSAIIVVLSYLFGAHFMITPLFLLVLALNCMIFAEIGFLAAMYISTYEEMSQVNLYVLLPMSFLCGTFFATAALPDVVRWIVEVLPLTHTSHLLRSIGGTGEFSMLSLVVVVGYAVLGIAAGTWKFRRLTD